MQLTYKFRLYPNTEQDKKLQWTLEKCRLVYNNILEELNKQETPNRLELQSLLPKWKQKYPELKDVHSKVLQYEVYRIFSSLKSLGKLKKKGRKVGKLRFKGKGWFKTIHYNQSGFKLIETNNRFDKLHLSKIGDIPIRVHREVIGEIKQITVKKQQSGKWFACIITKKKKEIIIKPIETVVGIDVGITHFATDSDGRHIENPHCFEKGLKKLRKEQRGLSKKKKKSENRKKQRIKVAKAHEKVTNQRIDFLHKLSRHYANNYDMIAVEDLNIKGMVRNRHLSKAISDVGWNKFAQLLTYKAENAGGIVVRVNPKGTSQECSRCGKKVKKSLAVRTHKCPYCNLKIDRDYNASLNILERGIEKLKALPKGLREVTPVEIVPLRELEMISASTVIEAGSSFQNL